MSAGPRRMRTYVRTSAGRTIHPYDADEDVFIRALRCQSFSFEQIARYSNKRYQRERTAHAIQVRLHALDKEEEA